MNYHDYNDTKGRDMRLVIHAWREARARRKAIEAEVADIGAVTLYMSKRDLQRRLYEANLHTLGVR